MLVGLGVGLGDRALGGVEGGVVKGDRGGELLKGVATGIDEASGISSSLSWAVANDPSP